MNSKVLLGASTLLMLAALYMVFIYVPTEKMGIVQRIFYLMVPVGWLAMLSFLIIFVSSILYLTKRESKWDIIAYSAAEIGLIFISLALIVGSIWAKPIWGVWWSWEARLTATLVLWFIYITYLMVRSFATDESRGARFAAVVAIIGFIDIPVVALATTLWRGLHPPMMIFQGDVDPPMLATLLVSIAAFTSLYFLLLIERVSIKHGENKIKKLRASHTRG